MTDLDKNVFTVRKDHRAQHTYTWSYYGRKVDSGVDLAMKFCTFVT